jgi:hypothetical protein
VSRSPSKPTEASRPPAARDGLELIGKIVANAGGYGVPERPVHVLAMADE